MFIEKQVYAHAVRGALAAVKEHWPGIVGNKTYDGISLDFISSAFELCAEYMDASGEKTTWNKTGWNTVYVKVIIRNIPSQLKKGATVGSLLAGDTIVLKQKNIRNLGRTFPYFRSWISAGKEQAYVNQLQNALLSKHLVTTYKRYKAF